MTLPRHKLSKTSLSDIVIEPRVTDLGKSFLKNRQTHGFFTSKLDLVSDTGSSVRERFRFKREFCVKSSRDRKEFLILKKEIHDHWCDADYFDSDI